MTENDGKWNDARDRIVGTEHQAVGPDGVDRRGFLKCMAWAGTGLILELRWRHSRVTGLRQHETR